MFFPQSHCVVSESLWNSETQGSAGTLSSDVRTQHLSSSPGSLILHFYIHITSIAQIRGVGMLEEPINCICEVRGKLLTLSVAKFPLCNGEDSPYFVRLWVLHDMMYIRQLAHSGLLSTRRKWSFIKKKNFFSNSVQPNWLHFIWSSVTKIYSMKFSSLYQSNYSKHLNMSYIFVFYPMN